MNFIKLSLYNDSVGLFASNSLSKTYPIGSITAISEEKSNVEKGAIIGGITGLLVGVLAGGTANPDNSAIDLLGDAIEGNDVSGSLNQDQVPFIVGGRLKAG